MKVCQGCKRIYVNERDYLKNTTGWRAASDGNIYFSCSCGEVVALEPANATWYRPSKLMSDKASSLFESLKDRDAVPRVSAAASKLIQLLAQEGSTTIEMVKVLKMDPVLAANVLKSANSARGYTEASVVQNLDQAINYLGRKPLGALVSAASLSQFKIRTKVYTAKNYWFESYLCGYISEALSRKFALHLPKDLCYLAGSLVNVGKLMGAIVVPDEVDSIYKKVQTDSVTWAQAEQEFRATDHQLLGEIACVVWGLPKECFEGVSTHHIPLETVRVPSKPNLASICSFANQLMHLVMGQFHRVDHQILKSCEKVFRIPGDKGMLRLADEFKPIVQRALSEVEETAAA